MALPLIALPGTSPRIGTGRRGWRGLGASVATLIVGEIGGENSLSPSLYGERMPAGR